MSAVIALQKRAKRLGGDAVVDIESITQHKDLESSTEFRCVVGNVVANVALSGRVVKFSKYPGGWAIPAADLVDGFALVGPGGGKGARGVGAKSPHSQGGTGTRTARNRCRRPAGIVGAGQDRSSR